MSIRNSRLLAVLLLFLAAPVAAQQQVQPLPKTGTPADNESNTNAQLPRIGAYTFVFDGATWDRWTGNVTITGNPSVVNAGTFAVQASQTGIWSTRGQDGSGNALTSATRGSERALSVQIVDGSGNQITSFGGSGGTASNFTSAFPASGTATGWSDGSNMQGPRVFDADSGGGTQYVAGVNLRKIASGGSVEAATSTDPLRMDPTGTTTQPVSLASVPSHEVQGVSTATTTNGTSTCYITSAASTNSTNCKGSAGNLYAIHITNTTTTNYYVRLYNASSAPTCSSSTGFVETIPALGATANGGINGRVNVIPQAFGTGLGFCVTGGGSSTDNTNAAVGVYVTLEYK